MRILRRIQGAYRRHEVGTIVSILIALLLIVLAWPYFVTVIPAGSAGVIWSGISGTRKNVIVSEGVHVTLPWESISIYDLRFQTIDSEITILSKDGLEVTVNVTTRYRPIPRELMTLHSEVGPQYPQTIVSPEVSTAGRVVAGQYEPEQFYNEGIASLQERVVNVARERVRTRFVDVDDVFIRSIVMPRSVAAAIQRKIEQEQQSLTMAHRIEAERQEAIRKRAEGEGIRDFQALISSGLTNQFLRYKGIEATLQLAQSHNAKIVVMDSKGLPLVLNAETMPAGGAQPVQVPKDSALSALNVSPFAPSTVPPRPTTRVPPEKPQQ
jgi:regulator of protease activity HflC (stomatin/prohibitin superfamily)